MADLYASLNGERIISGSVCIPYYGLWSADVVLANSTVLPSNSKLIISNLELSCHIFRQANFSGSRSARLVGGYGGWRKKVPSQTYYNSNGVKKSIVLRDTASIVGENVNIGQDEIIGNFWIRESCVAQELLRLMAKEVWWVDEKGTTQIKDRTKTDIITSQFDVNSWSGAKGTFDIATEDVASWLPARTFSSPTVTTVQKISQTIIKLDNNGKLRLDVMSTGFSDA